MLSSELKFFWISLAFVRHLLMNACFIAKFVPTEPRKRFSPANACVIINILWFHFGISFQRRAGRRICSPAIIDAESAHQEFMLETAAKKKKFDNTCAHETVRNLPKIIKNQVRKKFSYWQRKFCVKHTWEEAWSSIRTVSRLVPLQKLNTRKKQPNKARREEKGETGNCEVGCVDVEVVWLSKSITAFLSCWDDFWKK